MNRLFFVLPIALFGCGQINTQEQGKATIDVIDTTNQTADITVVPKIDAVHSINIFQKFAMDYAPTQRPHAGSLSLPQVSDSVLSAMDIVQEFQPKLYEKYLTLIFVKYYSAQMSREPNGEPAYFKQWPTEDGLDEDKAPLIYAFVHLTQKKISKDNLVLWSTDMGYRYVRSHTYLLDFDPIAEQVLRIEEMGLLEE